MKNMALTVAIGAACLGLAACGERESNTADQNAAMEENAMDAEGAGGDFNAMSNTSGSAEGSGSGSGGNASASAGGSFPQGARIVEEKGVTYRVDADGTRVRLGDTDSRIVVENGVRYRVDPGGSRVRINREGVVVDGPNVDLPDVDVGINKKGNLDVDVGDRDPDGGR